MTDSLLQSLRERVLDESEPLAGLLRKCLFLGVETGSDPLRDWARRELNGYSDDDTLPAYRNLGHVALFIDTMSGRFHSKGQMISYPQLPSDVQAFVPEELILRAPIEELESWAQRDDSIKLSGGAMPAAAALWSRQLDMFQEVLSMYWRLDPSSISGVLGQIRTTLVDFIAELTSATPLAELPTQAQVDAAFRDRIMRGGDTYNTTVTGSSGPLAVGAKAKATGVTIADVLLLLGKVQAHTESVLDSDVREQLMAATDELRIAASRDSVDADEVKSKGDKLKTLGARAGVGALAAATSGAAEAAFSLATSGLLG